MGSHVRAKFRCLSLTQRYDGIVNAELKPVMQKGKNSEENKTFWEYSPNGDCALTFKTEHPMQVGAYYYIDMKLVEDQADTKELWKLTSTARYEGGGGEVQLYWSKSYDSRQGIPVGMLHGSLKINMGPKAVAALTSFNKPGSLWDVKFNFAEPSDEG